MFPFFNGGLEGYPLLNGFYNRWYSPYMGWIDQWRSVLPTNYDQGFSQQELISLIVKVLNENVDRTSKLGEELARLELWIEKEGISNEVKKQLEEMLKNGELADIVEKSFQDLSDKFDNLQFQFDLFKQIAGTHLTKNDVTDMINKIVAGNGVDKQINLEPLQHFEENKVVKAYIAVNQEILVSGKKGYATLGQWVACNNANWNTADKTQYVEVGQWLWDILKKGNGDTITNADMLNNMLGDIKKSNIDMSNLIPTVEQFNDPKTIYDTSDNLNPSYKGYVTSIDNIGLFPAGLVFEFNKSETDNKDSSFLFSRFTTKNKNPRVVSVLDKKTGYRYDLTNDNLTYIPEDVKNNDIIDIEIGSIPAKSTLGASSHLSKTGSLNFMDKYPIKPEDLTMSIPNIWYGLFVQNWLFTITTNAVSLSDIFLTIHTGYTREEFDNYIQSIILEDKPFIKNESIDFKNKLAGDTSVNKNVIYQIEGSLFGYSKPTEVSQQFYEMINNQASIPSSNFTVINGLSIGYKNNIIFKLYPNGKNINLSNIDIANKGGLKIEKIEDFIPEILFYNWGTNQFISSTNYPGLINVDNLHIVNYDQKLGLRSLRGNIYIDIQSYPQITQKDGSISVMFGTYKPYTNDTNNEKPKGVWGFIPQGINNFPPVTPIIIGKMSDMWTKKDDFNSLKNQVDTQKGYVTNEELSSELINMANNEPISKKLFFGSSEILGNKNNDILSCEITIPDNPQVTSDTLKKVTNEQGYLDPKITSKNGVISPFIFNYKNANSNDVLLKIEYPENTDITKISINNVTLDKLIEDTNISVLILSNYCIISMKNDFVISTTVAIKFPTVIVSIPKVKLSDTFVLRTEFNKFRDETNESLNKLFNTLPVINNSLIATVDLVKLSEPLSNAKIYSIYNVLKGSDKNGAVKLDSSSSNIGSKFNETLKQGIDTGYIPQFIINADLPNQKLFVSAYLDKMIRDESVYNNEELFNINFNNYLTNLNKKAVNIISGMVVYPIDEPMDNKH